MDDQHRPMGVKAQAAARAAAREAGLTLPPPPDMDDAQHRSLPDFSHLTDAQRAEIERIYGFTPSADPTQAGVPLSRPSRPQAPPEAATPSMTIVGIGHKLVVGEISLAWYPVFALAFKFTVALAVINVPIVIVLYLLTR